jgi:hypothetical protein
MAKEDSIRKTTIKSTPKEWTKEQIRAMSCEPKNRKDIPSVKLKSRI